MRLDENAAKPVSGDEPESYRFGDFYNEHLTNPNADADCGELVPEIRARLAGEGRSMVEKTAADAVRRARFMLGTLSRLMRTQSLDMNCPRRDNPDDDGFSRCVAAYDAAKEAEAAAQRSASIATGIRVQLEDQMRSCQKMADFIAGPVLDEEETYGYSHDLHKMFPESDEIMHHYRTTRERTDDFWEHRSDGEQGRYQIAGPVDRRPA